jgi:hypothetical protein
MSPPHTHTHTHNIYIYQCKWVREKNEVVRLGRGRFI